MITVECAQCGSEARVSDQLAGRIGKCKSCGQRVAVPDRDELHLGNSFVVAASPPVGEQHAAGNEIVKPKTKVSTRFIAAVVLQVGAVIAWLPLLLRIVSENYDTRFFNDLMATNAACVAFGWPAIFLITWLLYVWIRRPGLLLMISAFPYIHFGLLIAPVLGWGFLPIAIVALGVIIAIVAESHFA